MNELTIWEKWSILSQKTCPVIIYKQPNYLNVVVTMHNVNVLCVASCLAGNPLTCMYMLIFFFFCKQGMSNTPG